MHCQYMRNTPEDPVPVNYVHVCTRMKKFRILCLSPINIKFLIFFTEIQYSCQSPPPKQPVCTVKIIRHRQFRNDSFNNGTQVSDWNTWKKHACILHYRLNVNLFLQSFLSLCQCSTLHNSEKKTNKNIMHSSTFSWFKNHQCTISPQSHLPLYSEWIDRLIHC